MTEGIDYNFVERAEAELYSIKLETGDWAGVIYTYGRVSIKEDPAEDRAVLSFGYRIEDTEGTSHDAKDLENDDRFKNMIGDILANILSESDIQIGKHGTGTGDDNHKGTSER